MTVFRKIYWLMIISLTFIVGGCVDFLEEDNRDLVSTSDFYRNELDAKQALNGIYKRLNNRNVTGDVIRHVPTDLTKRADWDDGSGLSDFTFGADNVVFKDIWANHYGIIKDCNTAIDNITKNQDLIKNWERYVAQAKGVRAYLYLNLVRFYGGVPLVLKEVTSLENLEVPRNTAAEVFEVIIADLEYAAAYSMSKDDRSNGYQFGLFTKEASLGFLAKTHLWLASVAERDGVELLGSSNDNFRAALDYAQAVIQSNKYSLIPYYADVFSSKTRFDSESELMFATLAMTGDNTGSYTGMMFGITGNQAVGGSWSNVSSSDFHRMMYEQADSVRRLWNCPRVQILASGKFWGWDYEQYKTVNGDLTNVNELTHNMSWSIGKFRRTPVDNLNAYNYANFGMNEPILRYADILLVYAEAYNEVHNGPGAYTPSSGADWSGSGIVSAYDAVNLVRRRARVGINGVIHEEKVPRILNLTYIDEVDSHLSDWKPGSFGKVYDGTSTIEYYGYGDDYDAFRKEILNERARELVAEGSNDRWLDLVRRGTLVQQMKVWRQPNPYINNVTERKIKSVGAPENVSLKHYLLPIPLGELDSNKKLKQNPGY